MQLISSIHIPNNRNAVIELLHGDLSAIPPEHAVDILVVSAFPGDYTPVDGSLMGSLAHKGLSIRDLAIYKKLDLRTQLGCWLSEPLCKEQQQQFNIGSVLCFEPRTQSNAPEEVVGNLFRCINSIAFDDEHNSISMPVIATGNQRVSIQTMLPALLEATIFWLQNGLPLHAVKLVVYSAGQLAVAKALFDEVKKRLEQKGTPAAAKT